MHRLPHRTPHALPAALLALLGACAVLPPPAEFPGASSAPTAERAATAMQRGNYVEAAEVYEALAGKAAGAEQAGLQLRAARAWLSASRFADATRMLPAAATLAAELRSERALLDAELTLASGQAQQAWAKIAALPEPADATAPSYLDARMRIALAAARPVDAVRAEVRAEALAAGAAQRSEVRGRLLALLRQARERGVRLDPAASTDAVIKGWLDLGAMVGSSRGASLAGGADAARWRARYPAHPATELVNDALPAAISGSSIAQVALLLPANGTGSTEARLIREGFEFALQQVAQGTRPQLRVYDTSGTPAVEQMAAARAAGADFIVGPFLRADVTAAAAAGAPPAPVLALNFLAGEDAGPAGFFQFALSPEDEARDTARRILASGGKRGVALAPVSEWGNRSLAAFTQELRAGNGVLLAQASYDVTKTDFSAVIKQVLGTGESEARLLRLQRLAGGRFEFEPRRRADLDFIYVAASTSTAARLLRPQLTYNYAGEVPVYMSSSAYVPDSQETAQDLSGVILPEMPWRLPDASLDAVRAEAAEKSGSPAWRSTYFAFGYDALQLALSIAGNRREPGRVQVAGLTGQLRIAGNGRVRRELQWARIKDGSATLVDHLTAGN